MSKQKINCVYGIKNKKDNQYIYVGSTTYFHKRKRIHKSYCNNINRKSYNYPLYKYIREKNGFNNFQFDILESVEFEKDLDNKNKKNILCKLEQEYINKFNPICNCYRPYITIEEKKIRDSINNKIRYEEKRDGIREKQKIHYEEKREEILEKKKIDYEKNKYERYCEICETHIVDKSKNNHSNFNKHIKSLTHQDNLLKRQKNT